MWTRVIALCWLLLLIINTNANAHNEDDVDGDGDGSEYEIHNLHDSEIINKEHLSEHMEHLNKEQVENMSEEEAEFNFFNSHDYDKNHHLDGLEILSSLAHSFTEEHILGAPPSLENMSEVEIKQMYQNRHERLMNFMTSLIDEVMRISDKNDDGHLNYAEFKHARELQKQQNEENAKKNKNHKHVVKEQ